jgi:pimeloyl-ACP methyl ester carboxylesterase
MVDVHSDLREGYAEIGDVRLHCLEAGEGPLVVLLHGFPEFWFAWRQHTQLLIHFFAPALPVGVR